MRLFLIVLGSAFSPVVWSHGVHAVDSPGFAAGLLHPLSGADHLLAALGMGLWLSLQRFSGLSLILYSGALLLGVAVALAGQGMIADIEWTLAASLILTGLFLCVTLRLPREWTVAPVTAVVACHFYAHINEMAHSLSAASYISGLIVSTLLLLTAAAVSGYRVNRNLSLLWFRFAGAALTLTGAMTFAWA